MPIVFCVPIRAILAFNIFTMTFVSYMMRVNLSILIIAMTKPTGIKAGTISDSECLANASATGNATAELPDYGPRLDWDQSVQGHLLAAYFYGYVVTSLPGGFLAEYIGPYVTVLMSICFSAAITVFCKFAGDVHYSFLLALRVLLGILGGVLYPALQCIIGRWVPPNEKGIFIGCLLGGTFGTVVTWPLLGFTIERIGWTWSFYVCGGISLFFGIIWYFTVSDYPDKHKCISTSEKNYINEALGTNIAKKKSVPPYLDILKSLPFWALVFLQFGNLWGLYFLLTLSPKFLAEIMGFNLRNSGFLSAAPHLARLLCGFLFGIIGDCLRKHSTRSVTFVRKFFVLFSHILPAVCVFLITVVGCHQTMVVVFLILALAFNGSCTITNLQNPQDLAPNYAGTIYGIINAIGSLSGFLVPVIGGALTKKHNGLFEWHIIFWIGGTIYVLCAVFFIFFGSGELQPWNTKKPDEDEDS